MQPSIKMKSDTVHRICLNLRHPLDARRRIHFTARAIKMISSLFYDDKVDIITLHSYLLRLAYIRRCMDDDNYITMSDVATYFFLVGIIDPSTLERVANMFDVEHDSRHREVSNMKKVVQSLLHTPIIQNNSL